MKTVVSTDLMRKSDAAEIAAGTPSRELMRRAGEAVYQSYPWKGRVAILCGVGNNAGDGYVLALCLSKAGIPCRLILLEKSFSTDGLHYFEKCMKRGIPWTLFSEDTDFCEDREIADCIFGTGFHGEANGLAARMIEKANRSGLPVVAVDINSGMNGDSGSGRNAIRSDITVAIGSYKTGHFLGDAKDMIGRLSCVDIGIPILKEEGSFALIEGADVKRAIGARAQNTHKGTYGYVAILGGCAEYAGAMKLANLSCAALRAGCGVATLAVPKSLASGVSPYLLESTLALMPDTDGRMLFDEAALDALMEGKRALAVGMGWGRSEENARILSYLLKTYRGSLLIDADGLNALATLEPSALREATCQVALTPHPKEFSRISGFSMEEIIADPIGKARSFAKAHGVCLLLKGACTVVTDGNEAYLINRGCAGMATAGSGDVLSGILAGLLGYLPLTPLTLSCGAYIAGRAGELAEKEINSVSMLASDTVSQISCVIGEILNCEA